MSYKTEINGCGDPLRWPRDTLYPQKLALTSPASGGRSVGIVRLRTKTRSFFYLYPYAMNAFLLNVQTRVWRRVRIPPP
jgi:hypothetical protein